MREGGRAACLLQSQLKGTLLTIIIVKIESTIIVIIFVLIIVLMKSLNIYN